MSQRALQVAPWENVVLRVIAIFKLAKAALFIAIGIGLIRIMHHNVEELLRVYIIEPMHFDPENRLLKMVLDNASPAELTLHKMAFFSFGAFFYATVFATEGIGLYLRKHWAEYMVLISTGALLPVEFYEIFVKLAWWKVGIVTVNLAILLYLVHRLLLDSRTAPNAKDNAPSIDPPRSGSSRNRPELVSPSDRSG